MTTSSLELPFLRRPALSLRYAAIASDDLTSVAGSVHLDVQGTRGREGWYKQRAPHRAWF